MFVSVDFGTTSPDVAQGSIGNIDTDGGQGVPLR